MLRNVLTAAAKRPLIPQVLFLSYLSPDCVLLCLAWDDRLTIVLLLA